MKTAMMTPCDRCVWFSTQAVIGMTLLFFSGIRAFAAAPTVTVTAPTGRENWTAGTTQSVTWSVAGSTASVTYYKVALSTDDGVTGPAAGNCRLWSGTARLSVGDLKVLLAVNSVSRRATA